MWWCLRSSSRADDIDAEADAATSMPVEYPVKTDPITLASSVPVRLTMKERKAQRLICGVLLASSYTDKVDQPSLSQESMKAKRDLVIARETVAALRGYVVATDISQGAALITSKDFVPHETLICKAIELARRYKVMNPDLLRTDYAKFLYLVQDLCLTPQCQEQLQFPSGTVVKPIRTVKRVLEAWGISQLLEDPRLPVCITPVPRHPNLQKLNLALRYKDKTVAKLCKEYALKAKQDADVIELLIRSLNDANNYASSNVETIDSLLTMFTTHFSESPDSSSANLTISEGVSGSRLSHAHRMQYFFVVQSLALWKNITKDMYRLWMLAEEDMLDPTSPYTLKLTGQGLQRVQPAKRLYGAVSMLLNKTKGELGSWVGSEKIHLGDDQVPNAFMFLDKYAQISRIIVPLLSTIAMIEKAPDSRPDHVNEYFRNSFGSPEKAKIAILADFFRHAFDGSGGDNMEDAGSCIDGRLTSAWNWCNQIREKPFYPCFLMAGFSSFDGDLTL